MKTTYYLYFLLLPFLINSCTLNTQILVDRPADINGLDSIKSVAIINRTAPGYEDKERNVLEGIITGETPYGDKDGAAQCAEGVYESLSRSLNYVKVTQVNKLYKSAGKGRNTVPFKWEFVDSVCAAQGVDALVVLEYFDSNSGYSAVLNGGRIPYGIPNGLPNPRYPGNQPANVSVLTAWRFYDPKSKTMVDEFQLSKSANNGYNYRSPYLLGNQFQKYKMVNSTGFYSGIDYGFRISEQQVYETREIFKGRHGMKQAARLATYGEWEKAFETWKEETGCTNRKIKARAYHNLAVYYEMHGDLEKAMEMARKAYNIKRKSQTGALIQRLQYRETEQKRMMSKKLVH